MSDAVVCQRSMREAPTASFQLAEVDQPIARDTAAIRHGSRTALFDAVYLAAASSRAVDPVTPNTREHPADQSRVRVPFTP